MRQTGDSEVEVSWNPPLTPPRMGYQIAVTGSGDSIAQFHAEASPHGFLLEPGTYGIELRAMSEHYPSDALGPVNLTVRSKFTGEVCNEVKE